LVLTRHSVLLGVSYAILGILGILWGISIVINPVRADITPCHDHACGCGCHSHGKLDHFISRFLSRISPSSNLHFLLLGIVFAWLETPACPCCGPVFYILSVLTIAKGKLLIGTLTFIIYSLGQGVPVLLLCTALTKWVNHAVLAKSKPYVQILIGNILIFMGMIMLWLV